MTERGKMTEIDYQAAIRRAVESKRQMDAVQAELDKAEDEYHQACRALDVLEGIER